MKVYVKDGIVVGTRIDSIIINNNTILHPTDKFLIENGYEIKNLEDTNNDIELKRAKLYADESDVLFNRYLIYKELGDTEKAEIAKQQWIEAREKIKSDNPYTEDDSYTKWSAVMQKVTVDSNTTDNTTSTTNSNTNAE